MADNNRYLFLMLVVFVLGIFYRRDGEICLAQWSANPSSHLLIAYGVNPVIASDGAGGAFISYEPDIGSLRRILLVRIDSNGNMAWNKPIQIGGVRPDQRNVRMIPDDFGGVFIMYVDAEYYDIGGDFRVRIQRVSHQGELRWNPAGQAVTTSDSNQRPVAIVPSDGGCIVAWTTLTNDLWLNRLDSSGRFAWSETGKRAYRVQFGMASLLADGEGGVIFTFGGQFHRWDISGVEVWDSNGISLKHATLISDGKGGVITGKPIGIYDGGETLRWSITMQRINRDGEVTWGDSGVSVDTVEYPGINPPEMVLSHVQEGRMMVSWGKSDGGRIKSFFQSVSLDGVPVLSSPMAMDSTRETWDLAQSILPGNEGTRIVVSTTGTVEAPVVAHRIRGTDGARIWSHIPTLSTVQFNMFHVTTDSAGGVIVVGFIQSDFSIRALRVTNEGRLAGATTSADPESTEMYPIERKLLQNFPNPFNPSTSIIFDLTEARNISISIYDISGRKVATLVDESKPPGQHKISWDASSFSAGTYICVMRTEDFIEAIKLLFTK